MEKYTYINDYNYGVMYDNIDICPICKSKISALEKYAFRNDVSNIITMLFDCPACNKGFIGHFELTDIYNLHENKKYYRIKNIGVYPSLPQERNFNEEIKNKFPSFCEIYNQAYQAEEYGLNQISGIGYRKALEFLIKDYCIYNNQDKEEQIKKQPLGQVIEKYINVDKIKRLSKVSTWIGNDETHYVRKYEDQDIKSLKKYIDATLAFITYEIIAEEANEIISGK